MNRFSAYAALLIGMTSLDDDLIIVDDRPIDPSTKRRTETCPNCGKDHHRGGHIFCSDECQLERREKLKNGELT